MKFANLINGEKFKGIRKGYSAIFVGEYLRDGFQTTERMRMLDSNGTWKLWFSWDLSYAWKEKSPCWLNRKKQKTIRQQVQAMIAYDESFRGETIFLGYVKEN